MISDFGLCLHTREAETGPFPLDVEKGLIRMRPWVGLDKCTSVHKERVAVIGLDNVRARTEAAGKRQNSRQLLPIFTLLA